MSRLVTLASLASLIASISWLTGCGTGGEGAADGGSRLDVEFERPPYVPMPGSCDFESPAFCETFEDGPRDGGRSGELDPSRFSVARGAPEGFPTVYGAAFRVPPAVLPECRPGLSFTTVLPDDDAVVCDPVPAIASRHLLTASAAQNYGVHSVRIRQPFDFGGRTGTIKLDVSAQGSPLHGFPAIAISADPTPQPSFNEWEHASGPRNGIEVVFDHDQCQTGSSVTPTVHLFADYVESVPASSMPVGCIETAPDALNHIEISLTQSHLEVWGSDASEDGLVFDPPRLLFAADVSLDFSRAYVNLTTHNHATIKYWSGASWQTRWDNVGYDGPVVAQRERSVAEPLTPIEGLAGCMLEGACQWVGEVIPAQEQSACSESCTYAGDALNIGYVLPASGTPVSVVVPDVDIDGMASARLAFSAWYLASGAAEAQTLGIRHRWNGGPWHDVLLDETEANAFAAPQGAGNFNQVMEVPMSELVAGNNVLELMSLGVTGGYPTGVANLDLVFEPAP